MNTFFEDKFGNGNNFSLLDNLISCKGDASSCYTWIKDRFGQYFGVANIEQENKFVVRYYKAKKLLFSSAQMFIEAKYSKKNECIVAYYYLMYYALFQSMQANLIISPMLDDEKVLHLSHNNVKKYFNEQFCKVKKCPIKEDIIFQLEELREYREYYSYAMPFNLSPNAIIDDEAVEIYLKICYQFLNLQISILSNEIKRSISYEPKHDSSVKEYMYKSCNRTGNINEFQDDADEDFWIEFTKDKGVDILSISLSFEHDFDEYGTYDSNVYEEMNIECTRYIVDEALSLVYDTVV